MTVSIIIPVYQVAPYIGDCLKSVMSQSYQGSMECLVVDDCGTDDSIGITERMIEAYHGPIQFSILHHDRNRGLSAARNTGMAHANGDYLFFLDSDDEITPDCIELLMAKAVEHPQAEMIQGNDYSLSINGKPVGRNKSITASTITTNDDIRNSFYRSNTFVVAAWNKLYSRSFLEKNQMQFQEGVILEDSLWTFKLLKHLSCVCFIPQKTYIYKRRQNSIVTGANYNALAESVRVIFRHILTNLTSGYEHQEFDFYAKKFSFFYARFLCIAPGFKEDLLPWQAKAKDYGSWGVRLRLTVSHYLAKVKYGWVVLSLLKWIDDPSEAKIDILRIWNARL